MRTYIKIAFGMRFNVGTIKRRQGHRSDHLATVALTARQSGETDVFFVFFLGAHGI